MLEQITRRGTLKKSLAAAGLLALAEDWATRALARDDADVSFIDYPADCKVNANPKAENRSLTSARSMAKSLLTISSSSSNIANVQRSMQTRTRLKLTGMVRTPTEFSLADLKSPDVVNGYECFGSSSRFLDGRCSCGRFTGVPLSHVLKHVGVGEKAREVVCFGRDQSRRRSSSAKTSATSCISSAAA